MCVCVILIAEQWNSLLWTTENKLLWSNLESEQMNLQFNSWIEWKLSYLLLVSFLMPPVLLVAQFTLIFWAGHAREEERNNEHYALLITNWSSYYSKFLPAAGVHSIRQVVWSEVSTRVLKESLTTTYSIALIWQRVWLWINFWHTKFHTITKLNDDHCRFGNQFQRPKHVWFLCFCNCFH